MTALEFALGMRRACRLQQRVTDLQLDVLLGLANGIRSVRGLADYFSAPMNGVSRAMNDLIGLGLVCKSCDQQWAEFFLAPEGKDTIREIFSSITNKDYETDS